MNDAIVEKLGRLRRYGLVIGIIGLLTACIGWFVNPSQFFISYLVAFIFWIGLSLGCLGVAMIHHLTGGRWGFVTRRFLEAGFMTLPWMAVLFLPLLLGLSHLYPWARPGAVAASEVLQQKAGYLNAPFFALRSVLCLGIWLWLATCLRRWSIEQDSTESPRPTIRLRTLSGPGIVLYPVTATFALVDWVMSLEAEWYSTIFPVILLIGEILTALCLITLVLAWFRNEKPFNAVVQRTHFHDLGNLLLAFVIFWTYVSFSQLLVIYSGDLPREIDWYLHRIAGGWKWVAAFLAVFHFFVPFFLLLFRVMKQDIRRLAIIAGLILVVHVVEVDWLIVPSFFPDGLHVHWLDFAAFLGMGGIWCVSFVANLGRFPLLPSNDPRIEFNVTEVAHAK